MIKRLYRSTENRVFGGIFGGLGEYFDVDPALFRLIFLFIFIFTGIVPGILVYILALFVIPKRPERKHVEHESVSQ